MKSPGGCATAVVPMLIALLFLWRNGHLAWLCWLVTGVAVFSWLSAEAFAHSRTDAENDPDNPERRSIYRFWANVLGLITWLLWILCGASIIASFF